MEELENAAKKHFVAQGAILPFLLTDNQPSDYWP